jgi:hypothetical protein
MRAFILLVAGVSLLTSCCSRKNCDDIYYNNISLTGFTVNKIDTVYIKSYDRNTGFTVLKDSFFTSAATGPAGTLQVHLTKSISNACDYKVLIPSLNKSYEITGISMGKEVCSDCIIVAHSYYKELKSYEVNGKLQLADYYYISM